jgi:hypothetical protein
MEFMHFSMWRRNANATKNVPAARKWRETLLGSEYIDEIM